MDEVMWVGGRGFAMQSVDRFGNLLKIVPLSIASPVYRALNGNLWVFHTDGTVRILDLAAALLQTVTMPSPAVDLAFDKSGDAWLVLQGRSELFRYSPAGQLQQTVRLPSTPTAVCVDQDGRVWVAQQNTPAPLVSWHDPASAQLRTVTLTTGITEFKDLRADYRPFGRSHVWLCGIGANSLIELDGNGQLVDVRLLGDDPQEDMLQLAVNIDGDVWVRSARSLYLSDQPGGRARAFLEDPTLTGFTLDAVGGAWFAVPTHLTRIDVANRRLDVSTRLVSDLLDDSAGYQLALAVDPHGDADGDGQPNVFELQTGTNPYDAQSRPTISLRTERVRHGLAEAVTFEARGSGGVAIYAFADTYDLSLAPIPGIQGLLRLPPARMLPVSLTSQVPGAISLRVPDNPALNGVQLCAQTVYVAGPRIAFANHTCVRVLQPSTGQVVESFFSEAQLDKTVSAGTWANGTGTPGPLGGVGRHGAFDPTLGTLVAPSTYLWSTDDMTIPATHTLFGSGERVRDGRFEFTHFAVPAGTAVLFRGANPAIVTVRGQVAIDGTVAADGARPDLLFDARSFLDPITFRWQPNPGEPSVAGGPFGGRGGKGAQSSDGMGGGSSTGADGDDVQIPAASGYLGSGAGTGGRGAVVWPADGQNASVTFNLFNSVCGQLAGGGGGGAFLGAGGQGRALRTFANPSDLGPPSAGGTSITFTPLPSGALLLDHFLLGGAGGGGGGSQPINMTNQQINIENQQWRGGGAGTGGGGALALRVGRDLTVAATGAITARGGTGAAYRDTQRGPPAPGGAGSGGSLVLQVGGGIAQQGTLDVRGGTGSSLRFQQFNGAIAEAVGGDGGHGYVRLEKPAPINAGTLGTVLGPPSVTAQNFAALQESDTWTGFQSNWYTPSAPVPLPPKFTHYVVRARIGGNDVVFSDDQKQFNPANQAGLPLRFYIQGALVSFHQKIPTGPIGPWRDYANAQAGASINLDSATGFRFMVLFDRAVQQDVVITSVEVFYEIP